MSDTTEAGFLAPGEKVLWRSQPKVPFRLRSPNTRLLLAWIAAGAGLLFLALDDFFETETAAPLLRATVTVILFGAVAAFFILQKPAADRNALQQCQYILSEEQAYIIYGHHSGRKTVESYPITSCTELTLVTGSDQAVYFAHEDQSTIVQSSRKQVGFEYISDSAQVFALMRQIQRGEITA